MRFEDFPDSLADELVEMLTDRLSFYVSGENSEALGDEVVRLAADRSPLYRPGRSVDVDFFLLQSCRFWRGVVEEDSIMEIEPERIHWHHQIRRKFHFYPKFAAITITDREKLFFQQLGPSSIAKAFHKTVKRLEPSYRWRALRVPGELQESVAVVRLLLIGTSFFRAFSFHVDGELRWLVPLVYPRYFDKDQRFKRRQFIKPVQLARILSAAPSFLGVQG